MVGPTNDTSARPRPSSSATIARLHPGRQWGRSVGGRPELPPSRGGHGGVELRRPLRVAELTDGVRAELVDEPDGGVPQGLLFGREADVHQPSVWAASNGADHSSRSVRRSTLPDGRRGISSTTTR